MAEPSEFGPGHSVLVEQLADHHASSFVHVGRPGESIVQYLTGILGVDQPLGIVWLPGTESYRPTCIAPERVARECRQQFEGDLRTTTQHPGRAVADRLDAAGVDGPVLAVPTLPHDTALYVEAAGYDLESTDAIAVARRSKSATQRTQIERAQQAAHAGIERARSLLSAAGPTNSDEELHAEGELLTVERIRRTVDQAIAATGVSPGAGTEIRRGGAVITDPNGVVQRGEPIVIRCTPRTRAGYHGTLARTIVVDSDGGWERRAHVAVENARQAALAVLETGSGTTIEAIQTEARAELTAYGFGHEQDQDLHIDCHGVGLDRYERPRATQESTIQAEDVLALTLAVDDSKNRIALADLIAVTQSESRLFVDSPTTMFP